jgi:hypothetical protein
MCGRAFMEAARELREERERKKAEPRKGGTDDDDL